jgi:hypothetical protein
LSRYALVLIISREVLGRCYVGVEKAVFQLEHVINLNLNFVHESELGHERDEEFEVRVVKDCG